jgi:hypothetical protein
VRSLFVDVKQKAEEKFRKVLALSNLHATKRTAPPSLVQKIRMSGATPSFSIRLHRVRKVKPTFKQTVHLKARGLLRDKSSFITSGS